GEGVGQGRPGGRVEDDEGAVEVEQADAAGAGVLEQAGEAEALAEGVAACGVGPGGGEGAVLDLAAACARPEGDAVGAGADLGQELDFLAHSPVSRPEDDTSFILRTRGGSISASAPGGAAPPLPPASTAR